jgi:hypothetical protein
MSSELDSLIERARMLRTRSQGVHDMIERLWEKRSTLLDQLLALDAEIQSASEKANGRAVLLREEPVG